MTASDYIKNQPHLQAKPLNIPNTISALAEFPPLSYVNAVTTQKSQTSSVPSSPSQTTTKSSYFLKSQKQHLLTTHYTKPITLKELQTFTNRVFYPDCLYPNDNITKNRTFYEYILVDSGSVEITHYPDKKDPNLISYSTCKILRIQSVQDLGFIHNHTTKPFSTPGYHIQGYTYIDYINAFTRTFYLRAYDHSWFISFDRNCPKTIPAWFYEWWHWLGPTTDIFPAELLKNSYPYYLKHIQRGIDVINIIALHIDMGIPWICSWHFNVAPFLPGLPGSLLREFRIKWWEKFNLDRCSLTNIQKFFQISKDVQMAIQTVSRSVPLLNPHQIIQPSTQKSTKQQEKAAAPARIQSPTNSTSSSKSTARRSARQAKLKKIIATISKQMESSSDEKDDIPSVSSIRSDDIIGGQDPFDL